MNVFILAVTLGNQPLSVIHGFETLVEELQDIFRDGDICELTTGDQIKAYTELMSETRRHEILSTPIKTITLDAVADAAYRAHVSMQYDEKRFGHFLLGLALIALLFCSLIIAFITSLARPVIDSADKVENAQSRQVTK